MRCSVRQRSVPALSSESSCLDARMDDGDAGDSDVLAVRFRGAAGVHPGNVADRFGSVCQRSAIRGRHRRRRRRLRHCLRQSCHHVEGSLGIAPQTAIDVFSGDGVQSTASSAIHAVRCPEVQRCTLRTNLHPFGLLRVRYYGPDDSANRGQGQASVPDSGQIGNGGKSGTGDGDGTGTGVFAATPRPCR